MSGGQILKVSLWGIDCPEKDQPRGPDARHFTIDKTLDKPVVIDQIVNQSGGRILGIVVLPDGLTVLNEELIKAGLAWWDERHTPTAKDYRSVEIAARAKRRGLWSDSEPVPPWEWRDRKRLW